MQAVENEMSSLKTKYILSPLLSGVYISKSDLSAIAISCGFAVQLQERKRMLKEIFALVQRTEDFIKIVNKGEKLKKDINEYYKPFNHEYEDSSAGLGLGLYISNNIIKIHNYKLEYEYIDDYHNFVIKLN